MEWRVYCENFVMIGQTVDAGDHFKKRAAIPLAPRSRLFKFVIYAQVQVHAVQKPLKNLTTVRE